MTMWWKLQQIRPPHGENCKKSVQVVVCAMHGVEHGGSCNFLSFGGILMPRSTVSSEILICGPQIVYPVDILLMYTYQNATLSVHATIGSCTGELAAHRPAGRIDCRWRTPQSCFDPCFWVATSEAAQSCYHHQQSMCVFA